MKKVLLVATVQSHISQFHKPLVQMLHEHGVEVHVAARNNLAEKNGLKLDFVEKVFDIPFSRSPKSLDNIKAYKQLKKIINEGRYDVVHCNTPMGGIIARLAAKKARKNGTRVIYTAHGFHFYKGSSKKSWIFIYPIEKYFANHLTDDLITITEEDYFLASKKFKCKLHYTHGVGVDKNRYHSISIDEGLKLREKNNLDKGSFIILCTGELNDNKNQITLLKAVNEIKDKLLNFKILLAGNGKNETMLKEYVHSNKLDNVVSFLGYRRDLENFVPCVDLIVSCSKREGLPLNIVEGMLCKKNIFVSSNRGHNELIKNQNMIFNYNDYLCLSKLILLCYGNKAFFSKQIIINYEKALNFTFAKVESELFEIYFANKL